MKSKFGPLAMNKSASFESHGSELMPLERSREKEPSFRSVTQYSLMIAPESCHIVHDTSKRFRITIARVGVL
jgi:hypothetical protein